MAQGAVGEEPADVGLAQDTPRQAFLATLLLFRVASLPVAVAGRLALGELTAGPVLVLVLVCLLVLYNVVHAASIGRPGRRWPEHWRRWCLLDVLTAHVIVALTAATVDHPLPLLPQTPWWFYVRGCVASAVAIAGGRTTVAVLVCTPFTLGALTTLAGGAGPGVPDQVASAAADLALTVLAALALLMTYRLLSRQVVADGLRLGRRLERADQRREVHDTVLQALEAIVLRSRLEAVPAQERLTAIEAIASEQAFELRRGLWPEREPARTGLQAALGREIERAAAGRLDVEYRFEVSRAVQRQLPEEAVTAVAGAVREALTNVRRHAGVSTAVLDVTAVAEVVLVRVEDAGRGFEASADREGFGISESIRNRVRAVGGSCTVSSTVDVGTTVLLSVPGGRPTRRPQLP